MGTQTKDFNWLEVFCGTFSILKLGMSFLNLNLEEEMMGIFSSFDWSLAFWIPVLVIFGQRLKKLDSPEWVKNLVPAILFLASFLICGSYGMLTCGETGLKALLKVALRYGGIYGTFMGLMTMGGFAVFRALYRSAKLLYASLKQIVKEYKEK